MTASGAYEASTTMAITGTGGVRRTRPSLFVSALWLLLLLGQHLCRGQNITGWTSQDVPWFDRFDNVSVRPAPAIFNQSASPGLANGQSAEAEPSGPAAPGRGAAPRCKLPFSAGPWLPPHISRHPPTHPCPRRACVQEVLQLFTALTPPPPGYEPATSEEEWAPIFRCASASRMLVHLLACRPP